jgi:prepilin-type N-terminal cleavage/methylation domain-containing protein
MEGRMSAKLRAFSLIELIVCVVLIAILAAILLPVFSKAKDKGKTTVCISNLRQVHAALKLYQQDHGSYPPNTFCWPGFKAYYPVVLECPVSTEQHPEFDYFAIWSPTGDAGNDAALQRCQDKRGGAIPIAVDDKHDIDLRTGYASFIIILRENGSVKTKVVGKDPHGNLACDTTGGLPLYGF